MSTNRITPKAGWVGAKELPRGPNGRALCRNCGSEVPKGRRTFCGEGCVDDWAASYSPTLMRQRVFRRDKGICALCGIDATKLGMALNTEWRRIKRADAPGAARTGRVPAALSVVLSPPDLLGCRPHRAGRGGGRRVHDGQHPDPLCPLPSARDEGAGQRPCVPMASGPLRSSRRLAPIITTKPPLPPSPRRGHYAGSREDRRYLDL